MRHPIYFIHWAQNAQIRPVRFFSNFKCCGNFAMPTMDQIFRGWGTSPPERLSLGNFPLPPPVVRLCLWIWMGYGCILRPLGAKRANKASTIFSNFKSCGNFAVPTLDQIFRGGNFPPLRGSGGELPPFPPPVVRLCLGTMFEHRNKFMT